MYLIVMTKSMTCHRDTSLSALEWLNFQMKFLIMDHSGYPIQPCKSGWVCFAKPGYKKFAGKCPVILLFCIHIWLYKKNPQWSVSIRKTLSTHFFGKLPIFGHTKNLKVNTTCAFKVISNYESVIVFTYTFK